MTFAGDVPQGWRGQLMRASLDRLIDGATTAATDAFAGGGAGTDGPTLAVAVSCVGRRLVLGERAEEELEAVSAQSPAVTSQVGFYSYGEICPHSGSGRHGGPAELHNQTMTVTRFAEAA